MNNISYLHAPIAAGLMLISPHCSSAIDEPIAALMIQQADMLKKVESQNYDTATNEDTAVQSYHTIKKSFNISHTEMCKWLGVPRRSLYNWLSSPSSSVKYRAEIETRLSNLLALKKEMEPEHRMHIFKIAFSPIYGNPEFGNQIIKGANKKKLFEFYDELYSKFESYRLMQNRQT